MGRGCWLQSTFFFTLVTHKDRGQAFCGLVKDSCQDFQLGIHYWTNREEPSLRSWQ